MSLIVAVYVPTGLALSGDSRTTATRTQSVPDPKDPGARLSVQTSIVQSDASEKVFLLFGRYGVGTFGDAFINNLPVAHYIEQFEAEGAARPPSTTPDLAKRLLTHFRKLNPVPKTAFVAAGYDGTEPWVISIDVASDHAERLNERSGGGIEYGILRGGDTDVIDRLLSNRLNMPVFPLMNLQDAADFSRHLIRSTIDQMRFEPRFPTVGGPIDTLLVTAKGAQFLARKALTCA
jgi:hypothetical protein